MPQKAFFTYMLSCSDGSLYTGWTTDLGKRIQTHNAGKGARYTRSRLPVSLAASWTFDNRAEAMQFEYRIKQMTRNQKQELLKQSKIT